MYLLLQTISNPPSIIILIKEYTPLAIPSAKPTKPFKKPFLSSFKNSKNPVSKLSTKSIEFLFKLSEPITL